MREGICDAAEIAGDLGAALEQIQGILEDLGQK